MDDQRLFREAFACLDSWGFEYNQARLGQGPDRGLGDWLHGQTEDCLMAVRGRPIVTLTNQSTALFAPVREHSRKPDEFFALVESLCPAPDLGRVELFARAAARLNGLGSRDPEVRRSARLRLKGPARPKHASGWRELSLPVPRGVPPSVGGIWQDESSFKNAADTVAASAAVP